MKRIYFVIMLLAVFTCTPVFPVEEIVSLDDIQVPSAVNEVSEDVRVSLTAEVAFDWFDISLAQRQENIDKYKDLLFENNSNTIYFTKDEFKKTFGAFYKDKEYKHHYMLTNNGVTEDEDARYSAFYYKKNTLVMYAIQYKNNPQHSYYYSAFGKLYYTDVTSSDYPNFPYMSMQYDRHGNLKSAIYFVSEDIQYMYNQNREFQGIWYKDKMYNKEGKQVLTRTNW